jgi:hypothetical protein
MYKNLAATLLAASFAFSIATQTLALHSNDTKSAAEPLKVGFVYVAPLT